VELVKTLSATLGCHVIAVDYRGFADSTGWPSEEGTSTHNALIYIHNQFSFPNHVVLRPCISHRARYLRE
jgi:pimeloyl-ACP methyl ester carboxylesterase